MEANRGVRHSTLREVLRNLLPPYPIPSPRRPLHSLIVTAQQEAYIYPPEGVYIALVCPFRPEERAFVFTIARARTLARAAHRMHSALRRVALAVQHRALR